MACRELCRLHTNEYDYFTFRSAYPRTRGPRARRAATLIDRPASRVDGHELRLSQLTLHHNRGDGLDLRSDLQACVRPCRTDQAVVHGLCIRRRCCKDGTGGLRGGKEKLLGYKGHLSKRSTESFVLGE